jgi:hypothetical protein
MPDRLTIPIKTWDKGKWGELNFYGNTHIICAERFTLKQENYTFVGNHRVRLYTLKNNVHWKIPSGTPLDISSVPAATAPRRTANR